MSDIRDGRPPRQATDAPPGGDPAARPAPGARPTAMARPAPVARPRPAPRPLRIAYGMGALAAASALVTALASPSGAGPALAPAQAQTTITLPAEPLPSVRHVIQYVHLKPGQTAPPHAVVKQQPAPKPRVVIVTTRQSGAKP